MAFFEPPMIAHDRSGTQAPKLGAHMSIGGGLPRAIDRAAATGCESLQIFTKSSNQWRARAIPEAEVAAFRARAAETGIGPIVAHTSYLINLAAANPALRARSVSALAEELRRADLLGLLGVVLHPGAYTTGTEADGIRYIADGIAEAQSRQTGGYRSLLRDAWPLPASDIVSDGAAASKPFRRLLRDARFRHLPMVLETPKANGGGADDIAADALDLENLAILKRFRDEV